MSLEDAKREFFSQLSGDNDTPTTTKNHEATGNAETQQEQSRASAGNDSHEGQEEQGQNTESIHHDSSDSSHHEEQTQQDDEELQALKKLYGFHSAEDMAKPSKPKTYLIKNWIETGKLHLLFGDSGVKKTFTAIDMGLSIACDQIDEWCRMNVKHGFVLYLAGEGQDGIKKRYNGWLQKHGVPSEAMKFGMFDAVFHLNETQNKDYCIDNTIKAIRMCFGAPALIIIDTLNRYFEGDENTTRDMSNFINACTKINRELGSAILIISHTGNAQENKNRVRGSSALHGACDIVIKAEAMNNRGIKLNQTKHKDGVEQKDLILEFDTITLPPEWNDEDGEPITTLVPRVSPDSTHDNPHAQATKKEPELKPAQKRARETYSEAAKRFGVRIHDEETEHDLVAVNVDDWEKVSYTLSTAKKEHAKEMEYNRDRARLVRTDKLLTKRIIEGAEYYCLDLQAEGEDMMRIEIITALVAREKQQGTGGGAEQGTGGTIGH